MKNLMATLIVSTLSLPVMANEYSRPELDRAALQQQIAAQQQQASQAVVDDALANLKPLVLDTLVAEVKPARGHQPES